MKLVKWKISFILKSQQYQRRQGEASDVYCSWEQAFGQVENKMAKSEIKFYYRFYLHAKETF